MKTRSFNLVSLVAALVILLSLIPVHGIFSSSTDSAFRDKEPELSASTSVSASEYEYTHADAYADADAAPRTRQDFTHTVFAEDMTGTWCPYCPAASETLKAIYTSGDYPFYFVCLIEDVNDNANARATDDYNIPGYPTVDFDGGYREVVGAQSSETNYRSAIEACGARTVPDIDLELIAAARGGAVINITARVTNNGGSAYSGHLRVYLTEIVSRYIDYDGNNYPFGFVDYGFNQPISVPSGETLVLQEDWDGAAHQDANGNDFSDIVYDNIMVLGAVFNSQGYIKVRAGVPPSQFIAYYVDEAAGVQVIDDTQPPVVTILSPAPNAEVSGDVTIEAQVTDNTGISTVEYRIDSGPWSSMALISGSSYRAIWYSDTVSDGQHTIAVRAFDPVLNVGSAGISVIVDNIPEDTSPPVISNVAHLPAYPVAGQTVTISCRVVDESTIAAVVLEYSVNGAMQAQTMTAGAGSTYSSVIGPFLADTAVVYRIKAADIWENQATSPQYSFNVTAEIIDTIPPSVSGVAHSPPEPTTDDAVTVTCTITDNVGVKNASVNIRIYGGAVQPIQQKSVAMTGSGSSYSANLGTVTLPGKVEYNIHAEDINSNPTNTMYYEFTVSGTGEDTTAPVITSLAYTPSAPSKDDQITITARVTDNVGLASVVFSYHTCTGDQCSLPLTATMTSSKTDPDLYRCILGPYDPETKVEGKVEAKDASSNKATSELINFTIVAGEEDTTPPVISSVEYTPLEPETGETITVTAVVTDNTGVETVTLWWKQFGKNYQQSSMKEVSGQANHFSTSIGPFSTSTTVIIYVSARDAAGNSDDSDQLSFDITETSVTDQLPPVVSDISFTPTDPKTDEPVTVTAAVSDSSDIEKVTFSYFDEQWIIKPMTLGQSDTYAVTITFSNHGDFPCWILAKDSVGNEREVQFSISVQKASDTTPPDDGQGQSQTGGGSQSTPGFEATVVILGLLTVISIAIAWNHISRRRL